MILNSTGIVVGVIVVALIFAVAASCVKIVPQANAYVIERLGAYHATWGTGIHFLVPIFDRVAKKVSLKETVKDFEPQPVITKDNVTMQIDTVVFYTITDPKAYCYGVENPVYAIEKLTATTLRNIIGEIELDSTLTSRDIINNKMRTILDEATDPWGIKVSRVELKNILPPKDIRDAMEKQMRAERERREAVLKAEGEKRAAILTAEGEKQAKILQAEANREVLIQEAEGERQSKILKAEGEAAAILKVQEATSKGLELIREAKVDKATLTIKAYDALVDVSKGNATKLIIPSDLQAMAGLVSSAVETAESTKSKK